jgi:hypothetical protein
MKIVKIYIKLIVQFNKLPQAVKVTTIYIRGYTECKFKYNITFKNKLSNIFIFLNQPLS